MKNYAVVGACPLCSQGRLIVAKDNGSAQLYVLCKECESEWESPEQANDVIYATRDVHGPSTLLERADLEGHEWSRFLF